MLVTSLIAVATASLLTVGQGNGLSPKWAIGAAVQLVKNQTPLQNPVLQVATVTHNKSGDLVRTEVPLQPANRQPFHGSLHLILPPRQEHGPPDEINGGAQ